MKKIKVMMGVLLLAAALLTGCSQGEKEVFRQKTFDADGREVREIAVDVRDREIQVVLSGDDSVRIDYAESGKQTYDVALSDQGVLTMTAASGKEWRDYVGVNASAEDRRIVLHVPAGKLDALELRTNKEDVTLPALLEADRVTLEVTDGDVSFDRLRVGECLDVTSKNGDVRGSVVGGYDDFAMTCAVKKGESSLPEEKAGGDKTLRVSANNGDVAIEFVKE